MAAIKSVERRYAALPLLIALTFLIALGAAGTFASIQNARTTNAASRADVQRNAQLTRDLTKLTSDYAEQQAAAERAAGTFREDNRRLTLALCAQVAALAKRAGVPVDPCPPVPAPPNRKVSK